MSRTRRAVIVTLPLQCDIKEADSLIHRNIAWVRERLGSLPDLVTFECGAVLPLRGVPHRLLFTGRRAGARSMVSSRVSLQGASELCVAGERRHAPRRLREWLFEQARRDIAARIAIHAATLNLSAKRIAVRDQTSRWGSCSTTGVLSFSWRLVLAPPFVLDYVAAHEVAHLAEMNHGPRFWALVRKAMPDFETSKQWLRACGSDLHRYGPEPSLTESG